MIQLNPWGGGTAVFCDASEVALLMEGPRAWLAFRRRVIGTVVVGVT